MSWIFHRTDPMGGASGEAYASTLQSSGMRPEHVLAREAIQNSVDALRSDASKVLVRFRTLRLQGKDKRTFVRAAGLTDIAKRAAVLELPEPNCLTGLDAEDVPLALLFVEDFHAVGLNGDPHDRNSNFYRLLLSLGDRTKARFDEGSGGSYGFGKAVYSAGSAIRTIFAYTRFKDTSGKHKNRLFGCGYYASHEFGKQNFSGRAWLGAQHRQDRDGRVVVDPFEDDQADSLAERLGFVKRNGDETGTSLLIVDSSGDPLEIACGVEDWWWPRLIEDQLDVEVLTDDGKMIIPRPRKRPDLAPFIESFEIAVQRAAPVNGGQKYQSFNALEGQQLGACGYMLLPVADDGNMPVPEDRQNCVAMIRKPRMVVVYEKCGSPAPPAVGAYVSASDIEKALKLSEPPAHDKWDPQSTNLRDKSGRQKRLVEAVLSRTRTNLRRFQASASPPAPPRPKRLAFLERALGAYFLSTGKGTPRPPSVASPLHLVYDQQPRAEVVKGEQLRIKSAFTVSLEDSVDEEIVDLLLHVACPVIEDAGHEGDDLAVSLKSNDVQLKPVPDSPATFAFSLKPGEKAKFKVVSDPYDSDWTVRLRPEISRVEDHE